MQAHRLITPDEINDKATPQHRRARSDGTTLVFQHAHLNLALSNVSRQVVWVLPARASFLQFRTAIERYVQNDKVVQAFVPSRVCS